MAAGANVNLEVLEGTIDDRYCYRYDAANDLLTIKLLAYKNAATYGEERPDGTILLRRSDNDRAIGLTAPDWWQTSGGGGRLPDSLAAIHRQIAAMAGKVGE